MGLSHRATASETKLTDTQRRLRSKGSTRSHWDTICAKMEAVEFCVDLFYYCQSCFWKSPDKNRVLTKNTIFSFLLSADVLISRLSIQRVLDVGSEWTEDRHVLPQNTSMEYDIRVTCENNYYGNGCADLCRPRDDQFGHYTCSSNGEIVCLSGWEGAYCTKRKYR